MDDLNSLESPDVASSVVRRLPARVDFRRDADRDLRRAAAAVVLLGGAALVWWGTTRSTAPDPGESSGEVAERMVYIVGIPVAANLLDALQLLPAATSPIVDG